MLDKLYIRFGEIPEGEQSSHFIGNRDGVKRYKALDGVSVYECVLRDGVPKLIIPTPTTDTTLDTFYGLMKYSNRPTYLIIGDKIGYGPDNEPLVKNIKIIKKIHLINS